MTENLIVIIFNDISNDSRKFLKLVLKKDKILFMIYRNVLKTCIYNKFKLFYVLMTKNNMFGLKHSN